MTEPHQDTSARLPDAPAGRNPVPVDGRTAPVVGKAYDLLLWFVPVVARFRRDARYTLGERLVATLLDTHGALVDASYGGGRREALEAAVRGIDRARLLARLAHDLRVLDHRRYLYASEQLVEVGRIIGGWRKHEYNKATRCLGRPTEPLLTDASEGEDQCVTSRSTR